MAEIQVVQSEPTITLTLTEDEAQAVASVLGRVLVYPKNPTDAVYSALYGAGFEGNYEVEVDSDGHVKFTGRRF